MNDSSTTLIKEPIYFNTTGKWYTGKLPSFYDVSKLDSTEILEKNYSVIKEEILNFFEKHPNVIKPNYAPNGNNYKNEGWKNLSLYSFMIKHPHNIKYFPHLTKIVESIPNMITAQVVVLEPKTRVKAHFGETNALVRSHLGIVIPGKYPELGFRNKSEERCWEEGKVLAICTSHRHYVWNNTDRKRIILLVDTIHTDYIKNKYFIGTGILSSSTMKILVMKFPFTKKFPNWLVNFLHKLIMIPWAFVLLLQNKFNMPLTSLLLKLK